MKKPKRLSMLAGFIAGLLRCETSLSGADLRGHDRYAAELRAAYLVLRDGMEKIALERIAGIVSEMEATEKPLPDFLNAEDDDMGFLVNMDTGERMTWGGDLV